MPAGIAFEFLGVLEFSRSSPSIVSRSTAASFTALNSLRGGLKASSASSVEASSGVKPKAKENSVNGKAVPKEKKKQKENKKKGLKRL